MQTLQTLLFLEGVKTGLSKKTRSQETIEPHVLTPKGNPKTRIEVVPPFTMNFQLFLS